MMPRINNLSAGILAMALLVLGTVMPSFTSASPRIKWTYETSSPNPTSPVLSPDEQVVYFRNRTKNGDLFAINTNGKLKWRRKLPGFRNNHSLAVGENGVVYAGGAKNGKLLAINPDNKLRWETELPGDGDIRHGMAVGYQGNIYVNKGRKLISVSPEGKINWSFNTTSPKNHASPSIGANGTVYLGGNDGTLYAIDDKNKRLKWSFQAKRSIPGGSSAMGPNGGIYFVSTDRFLYALTSEGTVRWKNYLGFHTNNFVSISNDETIYVTNIQGGLTAFGLDGREKWNYQTDEFLHSVPTLGEDGTIYVGGKNHLFAFYSDGTKKWGLETGNEISGSPALASDGTMYIGVNYGRDRGIWAVETKSNGLQKSSWPTFQNNNQNTGRVKPFHKASNRPTPFPAPSKRKKR